MTAISVIIPTFREAANVREMVERIERVRCESAPDLELIIVDDDSGDGMEALIEELDRPWIRLMVRRDPASGASLSSAVIDGLRQAMGEILVVMDADLSHPPEKIPELAARLHNGADFALGSRYTPGGSTAGGWSVWRWLNSRTATLLARPFTAVRDPMSGFFALRRATFEQAAPLNPLGYKIGLELMVKCRCRNVEEVPIHFAERMRGRSKLTVRQQGLYLRHVARLLRFRLNDRG